HTAPAQAGTLLLLGPFLDYWLTSQRVDAYNYNIVSIVSVLSICILCIMRFLCHGSCCHQFRMSFSGLVANNFLGSWSLQMFILLSCTIAVGTNLSQFICIGRFTAVSFQVLGHMKTILVLIMGFFFFGKEGLNLHVVLGMIIAVAGMIWYGNASSKPGGKERRSLSLPTIRQQKPSNLSDSNEHDSKV
ncbi:hypothetical protein Goari_009812, partial [Gossypium aridum]|nr:hypothetical protein [Gossypium aridum]